LLLERKGFPAFFFKPFFSFFDQLLLRHLK
jgi:hypothetical protein